jgi:hypothetical protein
MSTVDGHPPRWRCPESTGPHGPADGRGRCPWCGRQYTDARRYEAGETHGRRTELAEAYAVHYDPDEGSRGAVELDRELRSGRAYT